MGKKSGPLFVKNIHRSLKGGHLKPRSLPIIPDADTGRDRDDFDKGDTRTNRPDYAHYSLARAGYRKRKCGQGIRTGSERIISYNFRLKIGIRDGQFHVNSVIIIVIGKKMDQSFFSVILGFEVFLPIDPKISAGEMGSLGTLLLFRKRNYQS